MKVGCFGCLLLVIVLLIIGVVGIAVTFMSTNLFAAPEIRQIPFTRNDGYAAQQKLFEVASRQSGRSSRKDPIIISEPEANAFLSRHLEKSGMLLSPIVVRFIEGEIVVQGQTAFGNLLKGPIVAQIASYLPADKLAKPVWVTVQGPIKVEGTGNSRHGKLEIAQFALGKQHLSGMLLHLLMGPSGDGLLEWPVPAVVQGVRVGQGQLVIATTR